MPIVDLKCERGHALSVDTSKVDDRIIAAIFWCSFQVDAGGNKCGARLLWTRRVVAHSHRSKLSKLRRLNNGNLQPQDVGGIQSAVGDWSL